MIKKNKKQLILSSLIILLPTLVGLLIGSHLPERITTHWNIVGKPDGWSHKAFVIWGLPVLFLIIHWVCIFFTALDPKNKEQNGKIFNIILWLLPIMSLIICGSIYAIALESGVDLGIVVRIPLSLLFLLLGNYMPKCKQNHTIGVKTVWALRNDENWNKTHRFTGKLWVVAGVLLLATLPVPLENFANLFFVLILLLAFTPMLYSYIYYRKQLKAGTAAKDEMIPTPLEKKMTKISLAIGILIPAFVGILLFTGSFTVQLGESSFTIDAVYWEDITINYEDIDNIEYRQQDIPGVRTFGYGSPFLVMGECKNNEFGHYIRYSYAECDSFIVLTIDGEILVLTGKEETNTKEIYDELIRKIS